METHVVNLNRNAVIVYFGSGNMTQIGYSTMHTFHPSKTFTVA